MEYSNITSILKFVGVALFFLFFTSSCSVVNNHYYVPPEANVLTLSERNDLKFSGTISSKDDGITNVQIGYSPIKHVGIVGSWLKQKGGRGVYPFNVVSFENSNSASYKSIAVGGYFFRKRETYYKTIIPKKYFEQGGFLIDAYVGIGEGSFFRDYKSQRAFVDFDYRKIFGQVGAHYKFRAFGMSYILKFGQLNIRKLLIHGNFFTFPGDFFDELKVDNDINTYESTVRFEYGIKYGKINLNLTTFSTKPDFFSPLRSYASFGILLNVDEFFKMRKSKK